MVVVTAPPFRLPPGDLAMRLPCLIILAAIAGSLPSAGHAERYTVEPMRDGKSFLGCMATNSSSTMVFVAVGESFSLMLNAPEFKVVKGDAVDGNWAVDDGKKRPLANSANGAGIVSLDLEANKDNLALFSDGDTVTVRIGKATHEFSLDGSSQALAGLGECMDKGSKK
jgi:hypothetical protein